MLKLDADTEEFLKALDDSTRSVYRAGLEIFEEFYRNPLSKFLDEVEEDLKKPRRQRQRVAANTLRDFVGWLEKRGYAPKTIRASSTFIEPYIPKV
jgi:methyltransferase-like protein